LRIDPLRELIRDVDRVSNCAQVVKVVIRELVCVPPSTIIRWASFSNIVKACRITVI
jgi:hypothetical protein